MLSSSRLYSNLRDVESPGLLRQCPVLHPSGFGSELQSVNTSCIYLLRRYVVIYDDTNSVVHNVIPSYDPISLVYIFVV